MKPMSRTILILGLGVALGAAGALVTLRWAGGESHVVAEGPEQLYTCAMHPQIIRDEPGDCPICGMRLTPIGDPSAAPGAPEAPAGAEREILHWRAPMDPNYVSDKPGKSPMGMDLIPVYADEVGSAGGADAVRVDPSFVQNFAVRTAVAERGAIPVVIRTVGILAHNEDSIYSVNTKYEGWIEKAYFNTIGEFIPKGAPLFEVYSPALVTTQQEYLAALEYVERLEKSGAASEAVERARSLLQSARERLRYWDVSEEQIEQLEPKRTVTVFAPVGGQLMTKMGQALEGMRLTPGMTVLTIANHLKLWVEVEVYETDIQHLREGLPAQVTVESFPGRVWNGRVEFFGPALDPKTRTLTAFVEVNNQDQKLRPGMYANVVMRPPAVGDAVKVPEQAVIHSGERSVVIVQVGPATFEPREVELGPAGDDYQEIRSGVEVGERVVVSSQFLIDSESNLKAAIRQLLGERPRPESLEPKPTPLERQH